MSGTRRGADRTLRPIRPVDPDQPPPVSAAWPRDPKRSARGALAAADLFRSPETLAAARHSIIARLRKQAARLGQRQRRLVIRKHFNLAGIQAAVKPASMVNTVPIADAAPGELSHNIPDAISSAVLDLPKG